MHISYALDVVKKMRHKAKTDEEKEALTTIISKVERDIENAKKAS